MIAMNCSDISELAPLSVSGELDRGRAADFDEHLKTCSECFRELETQARLDARLTHADPAAASAALCAGLLAVRENADPLAAARAQTRDHPSLAVALDAVARADESALARLAAGSEAGACWTTLAIALHALLVIDDYEQGVGWAIAQGGDADTNAAVTGALLGYRGGASKIPDRWLSALRERERLERAADGLATCAAS